MFSKGNIFSHEDQILQTPRRREHDNEKFRENDKKFSILPLFAKVFAQIFLLQRKFLSSARGSCHFFLRGRRKETWNFIQLVIARKRRVISNDSISNCDHATDHLSSFIYLLRQNNENSSVQGKWEVVGGRQGLINILCFFHSTYFFII